MLMPDRLLRFCRRHAQLVLELTGLALCYGVARALGLVVPPLQLAPSLALLAFIPQPAANLSWKTVLRVPVVAAANIVGAYFLWDNIRPLSIVLGAWSALAVLVALVTFGRGLGGGGFRLPSRPAIAVPPLWRAPWARVLLAAILAAVSAVTLHRKIYPLAARGPEVHRNSYGPIRLQVKLPGTAAGVPEPLITCGKPGRASLVFIRLIEGNRARVGIEFWGNALNQGAEFSLPRADTELTIVCEMPALFPNPDDGAWSDVPAATRTERTSRFRILVDGVVRLEGTLPYEQPRHSPLYFGANPLGGSFVTPRFSGVILQAVQEKGTP
jgi:hypothetical protein